MEISMLERHPKGSQAFIPLQQQKFLIIVAPALDENTPDISKLCAFVSMASKVSIIGQVLGIILCLPLKRQ
jgi:ureidoglycolate hydrolase